MYYLITREFPFKLSKVTSDREVFSQISSQEISFEHPNFKVFTYFEEIKELIESLLALNPKKRLSAKKALRLPIFESVRSLL
jgi:serine/threonine protein kinase